MLRSRHSSPRPNLRGTRWKTLAGTAAFAGATVGFTSFAGATTPMAPSVPAVHPDGVSAGTYLAGYQATPPGGVASASATFTVPKATCTTKDDHDDAQFDLGLDTTDFKVWSYFNVSCGASGISYSYFLGTPSGVTLEPAGAGDTVVTSVFESATATYAEVHDLTNHQYWLNSYTSTVESTGVQIGSFNFVGQNAEPIPTFSKATLSNATVNGDYLGFESPTEYNALDGGVTLVKSGHLATGATGSTFPVTFEHAS
jgi:hypothetical protein